MVVDVSPKPPAEPTYLGDAVYASFDGYLIALHLGSHLEKPSVYLEPSVMRKLIAYARNVGMIS